MISGGGAYGGGKAGGAFDLITFVQRPQVIARSVCGLLSLIVFGYIVRGLRVDETTSKDYCIYNDSWNLCYYGASIAILGFVASMAFVAGEYLFEQMSSVKTRKHYVLGDIFFSALWGFLSLLVTKFLATGWIFTFFLLLLLVAWFGCVWLAYQRYKQGVDVAFASTFESDPTANAFSYPIGNETDQYNEAPFSGGQQSQQGGIDYQAPTY